MPGGCWVCNPLCGKCQPPPKKSGRCPTCGTYTIFDRTDIIANKLLLCKKCGEDLSTQVRPQPLRCNYSGRICVYPCGKGANAHPQRGYQVCRRTTPPDEAWLEAHPDI
ncbi:hypothetical protein [Gordonibacter sp.]|uniref:hypothetical protein n=1 Tax=Gordonibacter sp. TaxID=1968902 RepID=UPI002FC9D003